MKIVMSKQGSESLIIRFEAEDEDEGADLDVLGAMHSLTGDWMNGEIGKAIAIAIVRDLGQLGYTGEAVETLTKDRVDARVYRQRQEA